MDTQLDTFVKSESGVSTLEATIIVIFFVLISVALASTLFATGTLSTEASQEGVYTVALAFLITVGSIALRNRMELRQKRARVDEP